MKILQIAPQVTYPLDDGGRISIYNISKHFTLRGHTVDYVCYRKNSEHQSSMDALKEYMTPYILDVQTENSLFGVIKNLFSSVPYNISKYYSKELEEFLIEYFKHNKPDVVHVDHLHMGWVIDVIRRFSNVPITLREHNVEMLIMERFYKKQKNVLLKLFAYWQYKKFVSYEPKLCKRYNLTVLISEEDEKLLRRLDSSIRMKTITAGVDSSFLDIPVSENIEQFSLFHIGSMKWLPNKDGLHYFLDEIFPTVVDKYPSAKLYVIGLDTEKEVIPEKLKNNVVALGFVDDIWEAVKDKRLGVVPLRIGGGMRIKIIEMMAGGKLLLSTSVAKEGIEVKDGVDSLVADEPLAFAQKIIDVFDGKVDERKLIENARILIREKYTWEEILRQFESEYLKLIGK